jgi:phage shock protein A
MNSKVNEMVLRLETRTRQLLLRHKKLQQQIEQLQQRLQQREEEILNLQIKNEELENNYAHLKMAKYIDMADNDVKDMRGRINRMVRDIDKCIAMLKTE